MTLAHMLTCPLACPPTRPPARPSARSPTHSPARSPTHPIFNDIYHISIAHNYRKAIQPEKYITIILFSTLKKTKAIKSKKN
jgi:hypothetical protein